MPNTPHEGDLAQLNMMAKAMAKSAVAEISSEFSAKLDGLRKDYVKEPRTLELSQTEKGVATVITAVVIALLGWMGVTVQGMSTSQSAMKVQIEYLTRATEQTSESRYTREDAAAERRDVANQFMAVDRRITRLEAYHGLE
ncbi:hypothetical protein ACSMXM_05380 [Pacificimonas sp. ICDLI1SI03]